MNKLLSILLTIISTYTICKAQQFSVSNYRDSSISYIESDPSYYNFSYPILSDILDSTNFSPPTDGLYLKAGYGHRYLSNLTYKSDNHGGFDYWPDHSYNGVNYNDSNKVYIISMCDGYISQVIDGPDSIVDLTAIGRSVRVTCDSSFQSLGFKIKINYRHLDNIGRLAIIADTAAFGSVNISKGDTIGRMGKSGTTNNVHLHMSTQTIHPVYGNAFVNTARLFDPNKYPGILGPLNNSKIELLQNWTDSALFRIIWPFNQTINQFEFINQSDTVIFNKEDAYQTGSALRDQYDCLPNVNVFAYQFNGKQTAQARYLSEMFNIPAEYPASPNRDTNLTMYGYPHFPITHDSVSFVYDFVVKNLSPTHQVEDFIVKVSDVWGNTVEGQYPTTVSISKHKKLEVTIFPNPTNESLNIEFNQNGDKRIALLDLSGKLILNTFCSQKQTSIDLSHVSKGMYLLQVNSTDEFRNIKLIKN